MLLSLTRCYGSRHLFFLMLRRPPRSTRTDTLFPDTTLFRSIHALAQERVGTDITNTSSLPVSTQSFRIKPVSPMPTTSRGSRSEEHTSELQSLMSISYSVFWLNTKISHTQKNETT